VPATLEPDADERTRGASGVSSDAFGRTLADADVVFRAARWNGEAKQKPARLSVVWNGCEVQHAVEVPASTAASDAESPEPGPLLLRDRGVAVRYRNIWLRRL
jgi:hypothetical protein